MSMLGDRKLRFKIGGGFAFVIISQIFVAIFGIFYVAGYINRGNAIDDLNILNQDLYRIMIQERDYNLSKDVNALEGMKVLGQKFTLKAQEAKTKLNDDGWRKGIDEIVAASGMDRINGQGMSKAAGDTIDLILELKKKQQKILLNDLIFGIAVTLAAAGMVMIIGLTIAFTLTRNISRAMSKGVAFAKKIAEGDLTVTLDIQKKDEIGMLAREMIRMVENLNQVVVDVRDSAGHVEDASRQVSATANSVSDSVSEQASSVEEIAATIEEMTSAVKKNAESADSGMTKAQETLNALKNNTDIARALINAMQGISESSSKIGNITVTVNEVAFQTNLLALNAAVEAARAGEHGKGFAVVADEVRALAKRSADAVKEIKTLIEDTVGRIDAGDSMVKKSGHSLEESMNLMKELNQIMEEIAVSSKEQARGIDELSRSISMIDSITQQNTTRFEQLASTSDVMSNQSETLVRIVDRFTVKHDESALAGVKRKTS